VVRSKSNTKVAFDKRIAAHTVLGEFSPDRYLLSHCSIVASVDTENGPGPLGRQMVDGVQIDRQFQDYYITPETVRYVNNNCFVPGTLVTMGDGTVKPIEQIAEGDLVLTHKGRSRKVTRTYQRDVDEPIVRIKPRGTTDRIFVTREHPFFVFRPEAGCVRCGKPIPWASRCITHLLNRFYCSTACFHRLKISKENLLASKRGIFTIAGNLTNRDFVTTPVIQEQRDVGLTLGQARLLGLFLAEGFYELDGKKDNGRRGITWAFHEYERHTLANTVQTLLMSEFGAESVVREHANDNGIHVTTRTNRELVPFFERWVHEEYDGGQGHGARTKTLHPDLLTAHPDLQKELLRAWFEGDGCLVETPHDIRLVGNTASRSLASQLQLILDRLGVSSRLCIQKTTGRKRLKLPGYFPNGSCHFKIVNDPSKQSVSWQVSCGGGWLPELIEHTYYERAYLDYVARNEGIQAVPELRFLHGYKLQIIEKIDEVDYTGPVFNIEVEEDNSYVANGFSVHNCDSFSRGVILTAYNTFVGCNNYVEHLQLAELAKGRVIDAVARDTGPSVYVDILVATDRKYKPLIAAIESKQLTTLSMGASVRYTICTKCGNVAADETQLCTHVKYSKGNTFVDDLGKQRKVAELCGHATDPDRKGGITFIDASWVANPAFTGAVLRNILTPSEQEKAGLGNMIQAAFSKPAPTRTSNQWQKAARAETRGWDLRAQDLMTAPGEEPPKEEAPKTDEALDKAISDVANYIREKAIDKVRSEVRKQEAPQGSENQNQTLIKEAVQKSPVWREIAKRVLASTGSPELSKRILIGLLHYKHGGWKAAAATGLTGRELLAVSRFIDLMNQGTLIAGEKRIYRTVLAVGGAAPYGDVDGYLGACRRVVGRELTGSEKEALIVKGRIFDLGMS
jgi:hypothetical protein